MDEIIAALESISGEGSFFTQKQIPAKGIDIKVNKIGALSYPLVEDEIKALISQAKPATFGWKDQTILDETVRKVWEIPKSRVRIGKKQWQAVFGPLLKEFKDNLGLPKTASLSAELHNMLIYEPGCFFKPHQDSEKITGMVATMIVILPTTYTGGEVIVDHKGDKQIFSAKQTKIPKLSCAAFYADCHHEVKELLSGYRVALTYNLSLEGYTGNIDNLFEKDFNKRLARALQHHFNPSPKKLDESMTSGAPKVVYLLDHEYTQKGLSWELLKNHDRARVGVMLTIAEQTGLNAYLALADVKETWDCDFDYDSYRSRRRYRYDDDDKEPSPTYIIDTEIELAHWIDQNGHPLNLENFSPNRRDICWTGNNESFDPYESEYEGWTGNYGNTLDRWYKRAAIILWKKEDYNAIVFEIDKDSFVKQMFSLVGLSDSQQRLQDMLRFVAPYWGGYARNHKTPSDISQILELAVYLKEPSICKDLLRVYELSIFNVANINDWQDLIELYQPSWCISVLAELAKPKAKYYHHKVELIAQFDKLILALVSNANHRPVIDWLIQRQYELIQEHHKASHQHSPYYRKQADKRVGEMTDFLLALISHQDKSRFVEVLKDIMDNESAYPALALVKAYTKCKYCKVDDSWQLTNLGEYMFNALKAEYDKGLRDENDWSIFENPGCGCSDCNILKDFLQDKHTQHKTWPLVQSQRIHVEQQLKSMLIPVESRQEKTGRPYKLILTKSRDIFTNAKAKYTQIERAINALKGVHS